MSVVSLVAYNLEELRPAAEQWHMGVIRHLARHDITAQMRAHWHRDHQSLCAERDLLLGQTCGYPLRNALRGRVRVVAAPRYDAPGCEGPHYASLIVVRADDDADTLESLRGRVCAFNSIDSHSGYNALRYHVSMHAEGRRFFARTVHTGAHVRSIEAVTRRDADVAAVDGVVWGLLKRHRPGALGGVRILLYTEAAPTLPYVSPVGIEEGNLQRIRQALWAAADDPALAAARADLLLSGFELVDDTAYERIDAIENKAVTASYPELH